MSKLQSKIALVSGASKGIGAGIALQLGSAGASVVVNYASDRSGAEAVVRSITADGGRAIAIQADVANSAEVSRMFEKVASDFGLIDILVNNAGVYQAMPIEQLTEAEFHRELNVNLLGPLLTIRESSSTSVLVGAALSTSAPRLLDRCRRGSRSMRPAKVGWTQSPVC